MPRIKIWPLAALLLSSSCATSGASPPDFCSIARPIYINDQDDITGLTSAQILAHNDTGHILCGWPYAR